MKNDKIGHNNPPKNEMKSVDYLISLRVNIDSKKVKSMRPKVGADGKYRATQISDSQINGFYAVCTRPGVISFHVRHAGKKYKCGNYLGTSNSITNARYLARKFIAAIRLGTDPATVRIENATKPTLGQVVEKLLKDNEYLQNFKVGMSRDQLVWRLNTYFLHKAKDKNLRKFILINHSCLDLKSLKIEKDDNQKPSHWRPKGIAYLKDQLDKRGFRTTHKANGKKLLRPDYLEEVLRMIAAGRW